MRLINTVNLSLHNFSGSDIPRYAILSHRWESDEVTFQDMQTDHKYEMAGWKKITGCCKQAMRDSLEWAVSEDLLKPSATFYGHRRLVFVS